MEQDLDDDEDYSHITPRDCSVCGEAIPLARLDLLPGTPYCVKCSRTHAPKVASREPDVVHSLSCQNGFAASD